MSWVIHTEGFCTSRPHVRQQIRGLEDMMRAILGTPRFDLHQSPLAAGRLSGILLQHALHDALPMLDQRCMFGTVLYLHKVCQFATSGEGPIPVLDTLCDIFREPVFMGEFSKKSF